MSFVSDYSSDSGFLLHNLLLFTRLLRKAGLDVSPERIVLLVKGLEHINIGIREDFYYSLRCIIVRKKDDLATFDRAFSLFWQRTHSQHLGMNFERRDRFKRNKQPKTARPSLKPPNMIVPRIEDDLDEKQTPVIEATQTFSSLEVLRYKDFSELEEDEIVLIKYLISKLFWQLGYRRTRRFIPGQGPQIDFRRSLRRNLGYGGEILELSLRKKRIRPRPLIVIADISGSMERYSRILLHFTYTLSHSLTQPVEAFLFGTRLTRVTRQLKNNDIETALENVSQVVPDWSGGTRIGAALKRFNFDWSRRVLRHGAITLLISDGWDRGDPDEMRTEMARLQRNCYRLIWLNPLLGSPGYEPLTRGIQTALPYIDDFLPIHNLDSLESLVRHLNKLDDRRPVRRQRIERILRT